MANVITDISNNFNLTKDLAKSSASSASDVSMPFSDILENIAAVNNFSSSATDTSSDSGLESQKGDESDNEDLSLNSSQSENNNGALLNNSVILSDFSLINSNILEAVADDSSLISAEEEELTLSDTLKAGTDVSSEDTEILAADRESYKTIPLETKSIPADLDVDSVELLDTEAISAYNTDKTDDSEEDFEEIPDSAAESKSVSTEEIVDIQPVINTAVLGNVDLDVESTEKISAENTVKPLQVQTADVAQEDIESSIVLTDIEETSNSALKNTDTTKALDTNNADAVVKSNNIKSELKPENTASTESKTIDNEVKQEIQDDVSQDIVKLKVSVEKDIETDVSINTNKDESLEDSESENTSVIRQEIVNALGAELGSNNQNSGKDLLKQNASEQVVKLSIEGLDKEESSDFSSLLNMEKLGQTAAKSDIPIANNIVKPLNNMDILNQINDKLSQIKAGGAEKIEIILKPENLGKINIELTSDKGVISAVFLAENANVKQLLERNIDILKNNLITQGVNLNSVSVKVEETEKSALNNFDFNKGNFEQGSEKGNKHNGLNEKYNTTYSTETDMDNQDTGLEGEKMLSNGEFINDDSLHGGLVDYKV